MSISTILANYKAEDVRDYCVEIFKGYRFINTAGHGYLCVGSDENGYSDAVKIAMASNNYSFILMGGLVYLEEDSDAPAFLELMAKHKEVV